MRVKVTDDEIKLRGYIWDGDGVYVSEVIEEVDGEYDWLKVRLHTYGGSVFDGNMIYNTLLGGESDVAMNIDGVAASMGAIIAMSGKKIRMARNAYLMIHAPSGYCEGNAKDMRKSADLLEKIEKDFIRVFKARTGKSEEDVKKWLDGDNWFSAEEALKAKLIDEIYDPVLSDEQVLAMKKMNISAMMKSRDENLFSTKALNSSSPNNANTKQEDTLMKKQIIAKFQLVGVSEDSSDTAVLEALNTKLTEAKTNLEARSKAYDELKAGLQKTKDAMIAEAVKEGKITKEVGEAYQTVESLDTLTTMLASHSTIPNLSSTVVKRTPEAEKKVVGEIPDTWDELKKNSRQLEQLKENDFDAFNALFKAKFGKDFEK